MRLKHIHVEGCGRFLEPVTIAGLAPGLNVLAAPNEAGKSTLFKAVRACIFKKHTTRDEDLRGLATQGASVPLTIEVGFEQNGHEYVARKTFLSSPRASLRRDGREIASGRAADEEIFDVLGLKPGSGRNVDEGAFGMLWVAQSKSFAPPDVGGAVKNSIEGAIEREVGSLVGGERARELTKRLSDELGALHTATGQIKKSGPLGLAQERSEALARELAQARELLSELEQDTDEWERIRKQRDALADPAVEAELRENLSKAREEMRTAEEAARDVASRTQAEKLAAAERDERARKLKGLRDAAARIDAALEERERLTLEAAAEVERRREAERRLEETSERITALEEADARDAQADAHLRSLSAAAAAAAGLPDLENRLNLLARTADEIAALRGALSSIRATARHAQVMDRSETELSQLRARLEAAATRIVITPLAGGATPLRLDDAPVSENLDFAATKRVLVSIKDVGEIAIIPPAEFGAAERERMNELEALRGRTIAEAGASSADDLQSRVDERARLEAKLDSLKGRLAVLQSSEAALAGDIASTRTKAEAARASIRQFVGEDETPPDQGVIDRKQDALQAKRRETATARKALQAESDAIRELMTQVAAAHAGKRAQVETLTRQIELDLRELPQSERPSRIAAAGEAFEKSQRAWEIADLTLQQARQKSPGDERLVQLGERVRRHERALENRTDELRRIDIALGELKGRIQTRGGEGLGERVETLSEEAALAARECDRVRMRAESLTLLRDTIQRCYEEQREQLQAPIRKRLQPFLNDLFPKAELTLDERFAIQRIVRAGSEESFERLSDGTREQIAVLVRLAMGSLLHERGEDVPIILDDALVFCDDDRIELMFDALNRAARTQQVIVLTCRGKSFRTLGGATLAISPASTV